MAVTTEQIDHLLADWQQKLNWVSQNLIDLQSALPYQRLTGGGGWLPLPLAGTTADRVLPALSALDELFQHFDLLLQTIDHAKDLRKQIPRLLGSEQKLQEIEHLLTGPSIQLAIVQIPLAQRGLMSAAETAPTIAPADLLLAMTHAFEAARDAVFAVDTAWAQLEPELKIVEANIQAMTQQAAAVGLEVGSELTIAYQTLNQLRDQVESDPLGVTETLARSLQPSLTQIRTRLTQALQQHRQIQQGLTLARQQHQHLSQLHQDSIAVYDEVQEKVSSPLKLRSPLAPSTIESLEQWLQRLETNFAAGLGQPIQVGLTHWVAQAQAAITSEQQAIAHNQSQLTTRRELRGRLNALQAKALVRGWAEDPTLSALAAQSKQLLFTRPTPLTQAAELVKQYEQQLRQLDA
jgi:hypothetical protein